VLAQVVDPAAAAEIVETIAGIVHEQGQGSPCSSFLIGRQKATCHSPFKKDIVFFYLSSLMASIEFMTGCISL